METFLNKKRHLIFSIFKMSLGFDKDKLEGG